MSVQEAVAILLAAGYTVTAHEQAWYVTAPPGSRAEELQPDGAVLADWVVIVLAKALKLRMTPQARMRRASRWN